MADKKNKEKIKVPSWANYVSITGVFVSIFMGKSSLNAGIITHLVLAAACFTAPLYWLAKKVNII